MSSRWTTPSESAVNVQLMTNTSFDRRCRESMRCKREAAECVRVVGHKPRRSHGCTAEMVRLPSRTTTSPEWTTFFPCSFGLLAPKGEWVAEKNRVPHTKSRAFSITSCSRRSPIAKPSFITVKSRVKNERSRVCADTLSNWVSS